MKIKLLTVSLFALAFSACEKQPTTPGSPTKPTVAEKTSDALKDAGEKTKEAAGKIADKTVEVAGDMKDAISAKMVEWKLTPDDLKSDLEKSGRIVRQKSRTAGEAVGEAVDSARIVTVLNGKLVADPDLSAFKINVDADKGIVTLKGSVTSSRLVGRVMFLALETNGVTEVVSELRVAP